MDRIHTFSCDWGKHLPKLKQWHSTSLWQMWRLKVVWCIPHHEWQSLLLFLICDCGKHLPKLNQWPSTSLMTILMTSCHFEYNSARTGVVQILFMVGTECVPLRVGRYKTTERCEQIYKSIYNCLHCNVRRTLG